LDQRRPGGEEVSGGEALGEEEREWGYLEGLLLENIEKHSSNVFHDEVDHSLWQGELDIHLGQDDCLRERQLGKGKRDTK
jgi:hypothetical protein